MAITSLDGVVAGMQPTQFICKAATTTFTAGYPHSLFYFTGIPAAAAVPNPGIAGATLTTYAGQIPFTNPASGATYLARLQAQINNEGTLLLCDRIWHNSGLTISQATQQNINSADICAGTNRDILGGNTGVGVFVGIEITNGTSTGGASPSADLVYTNSDGTGSRTASLAIATTQTSQQGRFYPFILASGDKGVKSIQSITFTNPWTNGALSLVGYRVIASLDIGKANTPSAIDALTGGMPKMYNNSVPFLVFIPANTGSNSFIGQVTYTQG